MQLARLDGERDRVDRLAVPRMHLHDPHAAAAAAEIYERQRYKQLVSGRPAPSAPAGELGRCAAFPELAARPGKRASRRGTAPGGEGGGAGGGSWLDGARAESGAMFIGRPAQRVGRCAPGGCLGLPPQRGRR